MPDTLPPPRPAPVTEEEPALYVCVWDHVARVVAWLDAANGRDPHEMALCIAQPPAGDRRGPDRRYRGDAHQRGQPVFAGPDPASIAPGHSAKDYAARASRPRTSLPCSAGSKPPLSP
jgi:hypothetical protein